MAAQKGKDLLLKIYTPDTGAFVTVAGLRSRSIAFNSETVDITHQESSGEWRELLAGSGVKSARITGAGIFRDASTDEMMRQAFFDGEIRAWLIVVPDFGEIQGRFQITNLELTGRHDGEVSFEVNLESAGLLSFTAL